jgi:hypothetical protein
MVVVVVVMVMIVSIMVAVRALGSHLGCRACSFGVVVDSSRLRGKYVPCKATLRRQQKQPDDLSASV